MHFSGVMLRFGSTCVLLPSSSQSTIAVHVWSNSKCWFVKIGDKMEGKKNESFSNSHDLTKGKSSLFSHTAYFFG